MQSGFGVQEATKIPHWNCSFPLVYVEQTRQTSCSVHLASESQILRLCRNQ